MLQLDILLESVKKDYYKIPSRNASLYNKHYINQAIKYRMLLDIAMESTEKDGYEMSNRDACLYQGLLNVFLGQKDI